MKINIETYGCCANISNSEIMAGILNESGYELVNFESADIVIVNTCTVKGKTEQKVLHELSRLEKSNKIVIVTGCMSEVQLEDIRIVSPNSHVVGINMISKIDEVVRKVIENEEQNIDKENIVKGIDVFSDSVCEMVNKTKLRVNPKVNIVQISQGCDNACSYCIVRSAKGHLKSFKPSSILNDIEKSIKDGCKIVWITSQDSAAYGNDIGVSLPALLRKIVLIKGDFKIRIGMMNPKSVLPILEDLIVAFKNEKMFKFLHLPIQSASDKILKDMNREYKIEDVKYIVDKFRKAYPQMTFGTDIIVGYPTEYEDDYILTKEFLKEYKPEMINISGYTPRPYTRAKRLKNLPTEVIKHRSSRITSISEMVKGEQNKKWIGWSGFAIVEEIAKNGFLLRNLAYRPIVVNYEKLKVGDRVEVKIVNSAEGYLYGEIISFLEHK
jgi:threonylcarbamoyladenosine tRNA methylthiotransferase CDKAL1